jgi:predicted  nucleic acid-binding Zn-ribbon protein
MDQLEREEEALEDAYNNGEITVKEYNKQVQELQRDYRAAAQEAAQEAYENEMGRW